MADPTPDTAATPAEVWPARVVGSQVAHLARAELDAAGATFRAICPGAPRIRALELVPAGAVIVWCPSCRAWADASGVQLPRSR